MIPKGQVRGFGADKLGGVVANSLFRLGQHLSRDVNSEREPTSGRDNFQKSPRSAANIKEAFEFSFLESLNYPLVFLALLVAVDVVIACG